MWILSSSIGVCMVTIQTKTKPNFGFSLVSETSYLNQFGYGLKPVWIQFKSSFSWNPDSLPKPISNQFFYSNRILIWFLIQTCFNSTFFYKKKKTFFNSKPFLRHVFGWEIIETHSLWIFETSQKCEPAKFSNK